jgi:hypothetical protein
MDDCKEFLRLQRIIRPQSSPTKVASGTQLSAVTLRQQLTNPQANF